MRIFVDRVEGGQELAKHLDNYRGQDVVVYGLPRGGAETAIVVARALGAPLDLIITRKIGHPGNPEYAIGAITDDGEVALNLAEVSGVSPGWLAEEKGRQYLEAVRRRALYLKGRNPVDVHGKTAILVDDGIATGYTMEAAIRSVRKRGPRSVVVAAPVASLNTVQRFRGLADEVIIAEMPPSLVAIGQWYEDFTPVQDDEVVRLMKETVVK
jgi:putative phosphoribosyl transferase